MSSKEITEFIKKDIPFIFVKFGDGEYNAVNGYYGTNCDGDPYTIKLKNGLIEAIKYYSLLNNVYSGRWHTDDVPEYFDSIDNIGNFDSIDNIGNNIGDKKNKNKWIDYHTFIMDQNSFENNNKLELFKSIKDSKRKKILIGNELLIKAKYLLNIEKHLVIPYRNWVENDFENILNNILSFFNGNDVNGNDVNGRPMIITCGGMGSKILIMELHKILKNGIFIDIGSGLDYLCTKKCSRGNTYSYDKLENYFQEILPLNWDDYSFNDIYEKAKHNIGIHLK